MRLSEQIANAMRVAIFVGQYVKVRTERGEEVAEGYVDDVDADRNLVRVRNTEDGSDVNLDVDASRYQIWVIPPTWVNKLADKPQNLFVRPGAASVYGAAGRMPIGMR